MGLNKPVDFTTAKLLKEKGFDYHLLYNGFADYYDYFDRSVQGRLHESDFPEDKFPDENKWTPVPYIHQIVMWLYEKHGIWIQPYQTDDNNDAYPLFWNEINNRGKIIESIKFDNWFKTPTEAYEAAIEYTLKNLI